MILSIFISLIYTSWSLQQKLRVDQVKRNNFQIFQSLDTKNELFSQNFTAAIKSRYLKDAELLRKSASNIELENSREIMNGDFVSNYAERITSLKPKETNTLTPTVIKPKPILVSNRDSSTPGKKGPVVSMMKENITSTSEAVSYEKLESLLDKSNSYIVARIIESCVSDTLAKRKELDPSTFLAVLLEVEILYYLTIYFLFFNYVNLSLCREKI
jgi:hypothetical protein